MIPVTKEEAIQILDDGIAFTKAAGVAGLQDRVARRFTAALALLPIDQRERICAAAKQQHVAEQARLGRKKKS